MCAEGLSIRLIACFARRDPRTVRRHLMDIESQQRARKYRRRGMTNLGIARRLGYTVEEVAAALPAKHPTNPHLTAMWQEMRDEGLPCWWIAERFGYHEATVRKHTERRRPNQDAKDTLRESAERRRREKRYCRGY
jgi:DNA-binding CsgD family transcriptional regulator